MAEVPGAGRREAGIAVGADKAAIREAVENWALYRDTGRWEALLALYTADAIVHTTWFVGSAREFVERGKQAAARGGSRGQHFIGAVSVEVAGDRAIAEARVMLLVRAPLQGIEVDVTCYCRFYDWFVRMDGDWRIKMRGGIYEKDRIDPVDPSQRITLDAAVLARFPLAYRHIAYVQSSNGATITPDLPTPGSGALERLYVEGNAWLNK
jgi:ketosteroid isomerase-like protein